MKMLKLAGCIILDEQKRILLLHRNTPKRIQWEIPGGKIDSDEDAARTAEREVEEELGVNIEIVREIGDRHFDEDGYTMHYTWFLAKVLEGAPRVAEPKSYDNLQFFSLDELKNLKGISPNTRNFVEELVKGRISIG